MSSVWLNGSFVDESAASISIRDTGLLHGAGVFTTLRSAGGRPVRLAAHLDRVRRSCEQLFIPLQYKDGDLAGAVCELLARNGLADARLRVTVTRGPASMTRFTVCALEPTAFITAAPLEPYPAEYYARGMTVIVLDEQKLNPYDLLAGHKALNYLPRMAALKAAASRGAGEALWFNVHNYLQSGSISNVFVVKDGKLLTPPTPQETEELGLAAKLPYPKSAVLPGITRAAVMEIARSQGIDIQLAAIDINALLSADEVFLTNSIMGVMPVCRIERRAIGDEKPGAVTRALAEGLAQGDART